LPITKSASKQPDPPRASGRAAFSVHSDEPAKRRVLRFNSRKKTKSLRFFQLLRMTDGIKAVAMNRVLSSIDDYLQRPQGHGDIRGNSI
jgi:hypothetical protein